MTTTASTAPTTDGTQTPSLSEEEIKKIFETMSEGFVHWPRAPIYHRPDEAGLAYEDVTFPSEDGVPLEGWYIPAEGSDRLIICNHPRWFNRAGLPSHLEP